MQNQSYKSVLHRFGLACLMLVASLTLFCAPTHAEQQEQTDVFKSSEFLEWPKNNQKTFMDSAVLMAGAIAAINTDTQGRCIYDWYFSNNVEATRKKILEVMAEYDSHPPSGVIIALAQKECGSLRYKQPISQE